MLFERSRKLKHDEKLLLQASEIKNTKDFDSKSPSPNYKSKTPSPNYKLKNKSPSGLKSLQNSSSKYSSLTKSRSITQISGKKSPLFKKKKSRENSKEKIKKTTKRKENISPMKTNTSCSKKKKSPSPTPLENSSFYTKSLKYDYNFSNSNSQSNNKKQRSLLSDKYKKLEKIYESLSKE